MWANNKRLQNITISFNNSYLFTVYFYLFGSYANVSQVI